MAFLLFTFANNIVLYHEARAVAGVLSSEYPDLSMVLHLDHCDDPEIIRQAVEAGFTSVMYDGSRLPYAENLSNTAAVVKEAHAAGVSVEAELGSLASGASSHEGSASDRENYTDPAQAAEFVSLTGIDALAVSIGTVHGLYRGTPKIRIDILREIADAAPVPLVLHGGSGTPESDLLACIAEGIAKINVNTELSLEAVSKIREALTTANPADGLPHLSRLALIEREAVRQKAAHYIRLFRGF